MALALEQDTDFGAAATYHRIVTANVYYADGCADIVVHGYVSEEARRVGKRPVTAQTVRVGLPAEEMGRDQMYAAIKSLPEFAGAVDC